AVAVRAQAHIDTKDKAIRRVVADGLDDALSEPDKELLIGNALRPAAGFAAVGLSAFRVSKNQIDIGRQVQLACAELAHAEHDKGLGAAIAGRGRRAPLNLQLAVVVIDCQLRRYFRY